MAATLTLGYAAIAIVILVTFILFSIMLTGNFCLSFLP